MQKSLEDIHILTQGEDIHISQRDIGDGPRAITISVYQVDLLIDWLKQAKEEIEKENETF